MRLLTAVLPALLASCAAFGQNYTISSIAGGGSPVNLPGTSAGLGYMGGLAVDPAGNVFMTSSTLTFDSVLRLDVATRIVTLVAGNGAPGFSGDNGPAASAQLNSSSGVAVDSAGNVYIVDNERIRKISNGTIATVAGGGTSGLGDNGPAASAQLYAPQGVAVDSAGNLYIADANRVRKVSNGVITTVAGNGTPGFSGDNGPATSAQLNGPVGLAVDSTGNLYIADQINNCIRKVSNGAITTIAGSGTSLFGGFGGDNGPATSAQLYFPSGVALDSAGNLYIADSGNHRIREVSNGVIATVAGNGTPGFSGDDGLATSAQLDGPQGVAVDSGGNLYILDSGNHSIREVSRGVIATVAGNGTLSFSGDNGPATGAELNSPNGVAVDSAGNVYIADVDNERVRKVAKGAITTVAGNGTPGFNGDNGPASSAQLGPVGVAVDSAGNLYIADSGNQRVRKVSNGVIATVAGNGSQGFGGDNGLATSAHLDGPVAVAVDSAGNLYIADSLNHRIRRVSNGVITTVAGNGTPGFSGDGGPATSAQLDLPGPIAVDAAGNLYIADTNNYRIRKISNGVITTVAGNGTAGFSGDGGSATSAQLDLPGGIAVDASGNLYIAVTETFSFGLLANSRVRKVSNGVIATVAGNGGEGFSGDNGPATSAELDLPQGVAVDSAGNVYVADSRNSRIRLLTPALVSTCTYSLNPSFLQSPASGGSFSFTIQAVPFCSWMVSGLPTWITVSGANSGSGPGTVTLVVAPNTSSAPLNATISIAGISVAVTQAAPAACTYSISPGGQAFAAAGGSGTISVTASSGCQWTAANSLSWVTITGPTSGTGSGTLNYQVVANSGGDRSGSIAIAGLSFTVEQASASLSGFTIAGSMAQIASGGYWSTTITLINTGPAAAQARLNFFDTNGNTLTLPLSFPQNATAAGPLLASTFDLTLNPLAELVIQTTGPDSQATLVGWAQLLTNGSIGGFAVFSQAVGTSLQEAVAPLESRNPGAFLLSFDNTGGYVTGVALANTAAQSANVGFTIRDDTSAVLLSTPIALSALGHTSFVLPSSYVVSAGKRGTLEFDTPGGGQISVLGLRFNPTGAFSTSPALTK